jgi:SET domain-containing protein
MHNGRTMYRPLPKELTIKESDIQGLGLFAVEEIRSGVIGIGWVKHDDHVFRNGYVRTPLGGFVNHSDNPNCEKQVHESVGLIWLKAMRNIEPGEELTITYTLYAIGDPFPSFVYQF